MENWYRKGEARYEEVKKKERRGIGEGWMGELGYAAARKCRNLT